MEEQELERSKQEKDEEKEDKDLPLYKPAIARKKDFSTHPYNLRPRDCKLVKSRTVLASTYL